MHVDHAVENRKASLETFDQFKGMLFYLIAIYLHLL